MPVANVWRFITLLLLPLGALASASNGPTPTEVVKKLMTDAAAKPPGPVEFDVSLQNVETCDKIKKGLDDPTPVRQMLVTTFNAGVLEGPLTSSYAEGHAAMVDGKIKLNPETISRCQDEANGNSSQLMVGEKPVGPIQFGSTPMWGDAGGFLTFVGAVVPKDGEAFATFCLVQQKGIWKVHCGYISTAVLRGDDQEFIVRNLAAFAKKG